MYHRNTYVDPTSVNLVDPLGEVAVEGFDGGYDEANPAFRYQRRSLRPEANVHGKPAVAPRSLSGGNETRRVAAPVGAKRERVRSSSYRRSLSSSSPSSTSPSNRRARSRDATLAFPKFNGRLPQRTGATPFVHLVGGGRAAVEAFVQTADSEKSDVDVVLYRRYRVLDVLGKGVSSIVVRAEDMLCGDREPMLNSNDLTTFDHRFVAIKVFRGSDIHDENCKEEAELLRLVSDAGDGASNREGALPSSHYILPMLRHIPHNSHSAIVFPLAGPSIFHFLHHSLLHVAGLPLRDTVAVVHQLLLCLAHMHSRGIVHCDIKPENVVVVVPPYRSCSGNVVVYEGGPVPTQTLQVAPSSANVVAIRLKKEKEQLSADMQREKGRTSSGVAEKKEIPKAAWEAADLWDDDAFYEQPLGASHSRCEALLDRHRRGGVIQFETPRFVPTNAGVPLCEVRVIDLGNSQRGGLDASSAEPRRGKRIGGRITTKECLESSEGPSGGAPQVDVDGVLGSITPWYPAFPPGASIQTSHYRAPEVMLGAGWDARVDVWSVGCLIPELLSGEVLFPCADSDVEHMGMIERALQVSRTDDIFPASFFNRRTCEDFEEFFSSSAPERGNIHLRTPVKQQTSVRQCFRPDSVVEYTSDDGGETEGDAPEAMRRDLLGLTLSLLQVSPRARPTAAEALQHPVFRHLKTTEHWAE